MKKNIFFRIFISHLLLAFGISLLLVAFSFRLVKKHYIETLTNDLEKIALALDKTLRPYIALGDFSTLDSVVKNMGKKIEVRITVVDSKGVVLADSEEDPEKMENHGMRSEILPAFYGKTGSSLRFSETVKEEMLYVAIPIKDNTDNLMGALRVSLFLTQIQELLSYIMRNVIIIAALLTVFSLLAAFFYAKSLARPIRKLAVAADEVAGGNFNIEILTEGTGEISRLTRNFNDMVVRIRELISELSEQKDSLKVIVSSIKEALIVINAEEKIVIMNDSFREIFKSGEIKNKIYWEVIREPKFEEIIEEINKDKKDLTREIRIHDRDFICSAAFLEKYNEIVVTLHEITEIKSAERIKKDFISNVSHELRTPLTAIKGFVETLLSTAKKENKRYLEIIGRQTDRLINIVKDLLKLSELEDIEEGKLDINLSKVDLKEIISNVLSIYEKEINNKGLKSIVEIDKNVSKIKADPFKLEQLFINMIENAIKYTEKGEIKIVVKRDKKSVLIEVSDTGIGIARKHLSRIFERFYVVDKSRSRESGGTGLGLSIVKHIVQLHKGEITVDCKLGTGTKFIIVLPIN
ncbi:HAMP domain-containing protein [candidate division WOR-3 bacterium]|nr:HAMP domain-containing protein [candidate division WOR-3 bacterium]